MKLEVVQERFSILSEKPPKKPTPEPSFQNLLLFLEEATVVPIDLKTQFPPKDSQQTQKQWKFRYSIAGRYLGDDDTLEKIAGDFDLTTRERIRQIVKKAVKAIWDNSPQELKERFPFEGFDFRKPWPLESRQRMSQARGGIATAVFNLISQGRLPEEVKKELGVTSLSHLRPILRSWGIDIPHKINDYSKLAEAQISAADAQKVLDSIPQTSHVGYMLGRSNPLIVLLSTVARKANLYLRPHNLRDIFGTLQSAGVPSRAAEITLRYKNGQELKRTYYILPAVFAQRAIKVLENAHELEHLRENPVTVLGKPTNQIPNTTELYRPGKYRHLGTLIKEIRGKALGPRSKVKLPEILEGCPVSVYRMTQRSGSFYRISREPELRTFLEVRLAQLGLL